MGQTAAAAKTEEVKPTWDDDPFYLISIAIHKSRRYHSKMSAFFQMLSSFVLSSNAILGVGAFIALIGGKDGEIAKYLVGFVAIASAVDNVFGFAKKAKVHADLCRKFTDLAANVAMWDATDNNYKKAMAERIRIEKDEPPIHRLVDLQARNEEMRSRGYPSADLVPLSLAQRTFGYVATFGMGRLEKWLASRAITGN